MVYTVGGWVYAEQCFVGRVRLLDDFGTTGKSE